MDQRLIPSTQEIRLGICRQCTDYKLGVCTHCHCIMLLKTKLENAVCPLDKWPTNEK